MWQAAYTLRDFGGSSSHTIEALTGVRPALMRRPFDEYDDHAISAMRSAGMESVQRDVDSLD